MGELSKSKMSILLTMKKISAFTILELVIVMLLTSFVVTAGYFAYFSAERRLFLFESMTQEKVDLSDLNLSLYKDFQESVSASLSNPEQLTFQMEESEPITYFFSNKLVRRKFQNRTDTFQVSIAKVSGDVAFFDNYYISGLHLEIELTDKQTTSLDYGKEYTPAFLINLPNR